jgi:hypothetical protein
MVFDDSFEHEVANHTNSERIVLLLDVWHPELGGNSISQITSVFNGMPKREPTGSVTSSPEFQRLFQAVLSFLDLQSIMIARHVCVSWNHVFAEINCHQ